MCRIKVGLWRCRKKREGLLFSWLVVAQTLQIYRAVLAPAEPSSQDRSVASQAKKMEMEARSELREQQDAERTLGAEGSAEKLSEQRNKDWYC